MNINLVLIVEKREHGILDTSNELTLDMSRARKYLTSIGYDD